MAPRFQREPMSGLNEPAISSGGTGADPVLGRVLIWPGHAVYFGRLLENEAHAHHAIQLSIGLQGPLSLQPSVDKPWSAHRAVATAPDQPHRLRCPGQIVQIYLDPESAGGLALPERIGGAGVLAIDLDDLGSLSAALDAASRGEMEADKLTRVIDDVTETVVPAFPRTWIDPRVQKALATAHASPGHHRSLADLADSVALSASRLGALFRRDLGIPVRRYLLWLRLIDAIEDLADGTNLTEAAHDAGFSDSAHLSRTFRRMFGMPPSALQSGRVEICRLAEGSLYG
jgi:AraC family transcriptional regulator